MISTSLQTRIAVAALILGALSVTGFPNQDKPRAYVAGRFALTLGETKYTGFLHGVDGGSVRAEDIKMEM